MKFLLSKILFCGAVIGILMSSAFVPAAKAEDMPSFMKEAEIFGQMRYRYEYVDQDGLPQNARASTMRMNLGVKTDLHPDFQVLAEGQLVRNIGYRHYNDTINQRTSYPVVADPNIFQLNRLWGQWSGLPDTEIKLGRQALNLDNQRFIGTVAWRQNDQTFDAVRLRNRSIQDVDLEYAYIWRVNRIFSKKDPLGQLKSRHHILRASYNPLDLLTLTTYAYLLDFDKLAARSSQSYGIRATGKTAIDEDWSFSYEAEAALQKDYKNNPADYTARYFYAAPGLSYQNLSAAIGYEILTGNGTNAFQTPLATLHKFNGWADKFLTTPADGLIDRQISLKYKLPDSFGPFTKNTLGAEYHNYRGDKRGNFGYEYGLYFGTAISSAALPRDINLLFKYTDYNAKDGPYTDTQKFWFQAVINF